MSDYAGKPAPNAVVFYTDESSRLEQAGQSTPEQTIARLRAELAAAHGNADDNYKKLMQARADLAAANAQLAAAQSVAAEHESDAVEIDSERFVAWAERDKAVAERDAARADLAAACEVLSGLALYLAVGSGDESTTIAQYNDRIYQGIDMLTAPLVKQRDAARTDLAAARELLREARIRMWTDGWLPVDDLCARIDAALKGNG